MVQKENIYAKLRNGFQNRSLKRDPSIRWLLECRVSSLLQEVKISSDTEEEWRNLTFIRK
jgi:hypothetical protein